MKKYIFIFLLGGLWILNNLHAQTAKSTHVCGLHQETTKNSFINQKDYADNDEAIEVVNWIMNYTGVPPNFIVQAGNVDNAVATLVIIDSVLTRAILYNPVFMQSVRIETTTDWAPISILAHEIGHHLCGHTLITGGSHKVELEADEFSGFILFRMGASLAEAQATMKAIASNIPSLTHPGKQTRLAAIKKGWLKAQNQIKPPDNSQSPVAQENNTKITEAFSNIYTEQKMNEGMLYIYAEANLPVKTKVTAWFYDGNKQPLKDTNRKYKTSSNRVATYTTITNKGRGRRIMLKIPMKELHLPRGVHDLYIVIGVEDRNTSVLVHSMPEKVFVKI